MIHRGFVFGPDEAALDLQRPVGVEADEHSGTPDLGRVEPQRSIVEGRDGGLQLAKTLVDLLRQFVGAVILLVQRVEFRLQHLIRRLFICASIERLTPQAPEPIGMAVLEVERSRDPEPAFTGDRLGLDLQLFVDQSLEHRRILQPATPIVGEEVAHHDAAGRLIGGDSHELGATVVDPHSALGKQATDIIGLLVVGAGKALPDLLLSGMIARDAEGCQLVERHAFIRIDRQELLRHRRQPEPLLDDIDRHEEAGRDLLL